MPSVQQAQPEAVITELSAVFGGPPDRRPLKGLINFMPVERLNAVVVPVDEMAPRPSTTSSARTSFTGSA